MVRIVPDAAERDVRLRAAARAVANAHHPGVGGVGTAVVRPAIGRLDPSGGAAVNARVVNAVVVTGRAASGQASAAAAIGRVATARVATAVVVTGRALTAEVVTDRVVTGAG